MAFGGFLKQSTAVDVLIGPYVDSVDGNTAETGLSPDVELSKNGQALADKNDATTPTHDAAGTVDGYYNCELDATDTNTLGTLTLVAHDSGALPIRMDFQVVSAENYESRYASTSIFDTILRGNVHNTRHSFGWRLRRVSGGTEVAISSGTAQGAGTGNNQIQLAADAESTDDIYNGTVIAITGGTGLGQTRTIFDYVGSTTTATVSKDWVTNPDATSTYSIYASSTSNASHSGIAQAGGNTTIQLATDASDQDDYYNGSFVYIVAGTGSGQTRVITDYTGSSTTATVATWSVNPDSTSLYEVIPTEEVASDTPTSTAPTVEQMRQEMDDNSSDFNTMIANQATIISNQTGGTQTMKTWAAAVVLHNSPAFGGTDAVLAADREYDYTSNVDLETAGQNGAQVLVEAKLNFAAARGLGSPAIADSLVIDVFASLDGTTYDTIPLQSYTIAGRGDGDFRTMTINVKDVAHFRLGLKTSGTSDTWDYRITHQRYI
jgi:hypothetical protein